MPDIITDVLHSSPFQLWAYSEGDGLRLITKQALDKPGQPSIFSLNAGDVAYTDGGFRDYIEYHFQYSYGKRLILRIASTVSLPKHGEELLAKELPLFAHHITEKQQKRLLQKMNESIGAITALTDLDALLSKILDTTMEVIFEADIGVLWMYDEAEDCLKVQKTSAEVNTRTMKNMRMKPGEGMVGTVFEKEEAALYPTHRDVLFAASTMSHDNLSILERSYPFGEAASVLCVPVKIRQITRCVLILYQFNYASFTKHELNLLQNFADQVGIALQNAELFDRLQEQNYLLAKRNDIHERLVSLSIQGEGAPAIRKTLEDVLGLPLMLLSIFDDPVDSDASTFAAYHQNVILEKKGSLSASFTVEDYQGEMHEVFPIVGVGVCLGYIICRQREPLSSLQRMALELGIPILALEFIREKSVIDHSLKASEEAFQKLLMAETAKELKEASRLLKIEDHRPVMILKFEFEFDMDPSFTNLYIHRFITDIRNDFDDKLSVLYTKGTTVVTLLYVSRLGKKEIDAFIWRFARENDNMRVRAGLGSQADQRSLLPRSYKEAEKALAHLGAKKEWQRVMNYTDIGINRLFIDQPQEDLLAFVQDFFKPLNVIEGKEERLSETLETFMNNNRSASQTARQLYIHVNTLYQRLKKIEETLQISFQNSHDVLQVQLACYLRESVHDENKR
ncbi:helix-turn-helix domain-containing protein [Salicibibacter cibarius]|uniref:Helix-turn-helix domain-containing protein n=1 Tax=Salicibibacter cibarius TaxID=2743000 RepID=A0A7T6Z3X8_9BACI|nr:helix-turn-helix domain-containing protein [Salicibibacter cibarius]QQK76449.1 helix-turn-helix domain-containing protein [Salicibibacter cibarius]